MKIFGLINLVIFTALSTCYAFQSLSPVSDSAKANSIIKLYTEGLYAKINHEKTDEAQALES